MTATRYHLVSDCINSDSWAVFMGEGETMIWQQGEAKETPTPSSWPTNVGACVRKEPQAEQDAIS